MPSNEPGIDLCLESVGLLGSYSRVWINGKEVSENVIKVELKTEVDNPSTVTITYYVRSINTEVLPPADKSVSEAKELIAS